MDHDFLEVACPDCKTIIIVRKRDGKVMEVRKPIIEDSSGDRFEDARKKAAGSKDAAMKKFEEAQSREKNKMERLNAIFKEGLDRAKEEGPITKRDNPMDLD